MKRDIDLTRQLLFDLEAQGPDCAVNLLRTGNANEADERVRYHLRLLIDGGLAKEVDRTTGGMACVRLTHAGVEMLELCRSDTRWRDAKAIVLEQTGGMSLTLLRTLLTRWAVDSVSRGEGYRGRPVYRPSYPSAEYRPAEYRSRYDTYYHDRRDYLYDEEVRLVRTSAGYHEREPHRSCETNGHAIDSLDAGAGISLPIYMV